MSETKVEVKTPKAKRHWCCNSIIDEGHADDCRKNRDNRCEKCGAKFVDGNICYGPKKSKVPEVKKARPKGYHYYKEMRMKGINVTEENKIDFGAYRRIYVHPCGIITFNSNYECDDWHCHGDTIYYKHKTTGNVIAENGETVYVAPKNEATDIISSECNWSIACHVN